MEFNSLTLNDQSKARFTATPYYWIRVTSIDGLFGEEIRYESHPIAGGTGERSGTPFKSGKQIVLSGEVWALGLAKLREGQWALQQAFWTPLQKKFYYQPWPLYAVGSDRLYLTCRVNQPLVITDEFRGGNGRFSQRWTVGLRADDPRPRLASNDALYFTWQS